MKNLTTKFSTMKLLALAAVTCGLLAGAATVAGGGSMAEGAQTALTLTSMMAFGVSPVLHTPILCASYFKVTRAIEGVSHSLKITFTAKRGQIVVLDPTSLSGKGNVFVPEAKFKLADGQKGYFLERDIIQSPLPLEQFLIEKFFEGPDVLSPDGAGGWIGYVSARQVLEAEIEGPDLIDASITGATAADTPVSTKAGKLSTVAAASAPKEVQGIIRAQLAPAEAGQVRLLVEFPQ